MDVKLIRSFGSVEMTALEQMEEGDIPSTGHLFGYCGNDAEVGQTYELHHHAVIELNVSSDDDFVYTGTPVYMPVPEYDGEDAIGVDGGSSLTTSRVGPRRGITVSRGPVEDGGALVQVLIYPDS